jgi:hypothetical protein
MLKNLTKFQDSTTSQYCILIVCMLLVAVLCYQTDHLPCEWKNCEVHLFLRFATVSFMCSGKGIRTLVGTSFVFCL